MGFRAIFGPGSCLLQFVHFCFSNIPDVVDYNKVVESNAQWLIKVQSGIQYFENQYGQDVEFTPEQLRLIRLAKGDKESRTVRQFQFDWLLKNKMEEVMVRNLVEKIQKSPIKTTQNFSKLIADACFDLSAFIKTYLLTPGSAAHVIKSAMQLVQKNEAIQLFLSIYETKENISTQPVPCTLPPSSILSSFQNASLTPSMFTRSREEELREEISTVQSKKIRRIFDRYTRKKKPRPEEISTIGIQSKEKKPEFEK